MNAHTSQPPPPQAAAAILNPTKRNKHARLPEEKIELSTRGFREPFATRSEQKPVVKTLAFEAKLAEKKHQLLWQLRPPYGTWHDAGP